MAITTTYRGRVTLDSWGEAVYVLFLRNHEGTHPGPLVEELDWLNGRKAAIRYWVSPVECDKDQVAEESQKWLMGDTEVQFEAMYSEITGYLWTVEELKIGGHDLIEEVKGYEGWWMILEIDTDSQEPGDHE